MMARYRFARQEQVAMNVCIGTGVVNAKRKICMDWCDRVKQLGASLYLRAGVEGSCL